jgi:hypothetical protein
MLTAPRGLPFCFAGLLLFADRHMVLPGLVIALVIVAIDRYFISGSLQNGTASIKAGDDGCATSVQSLTLIT